MKLSSRKGLNIGVFLLMYYIYFNSMKKIMIPLSSVVIPCIMAFTLVMVLRSSNLTIRTGSTADKMQVFSWIVIAVLVTVDNSSLLENLYKGGMIQLYVMICFFLLSYRQGEWIHTWIKWTTLFTSVHAIATVVFFFMPNICMRYARFMFNGTNLSTYITEYSKGYMPGLTSHMSSNGMILGIGLIVLALQLLYYRKRINNKYYRFFILVLLLVNVYALFLTSKRSQFFGALIAITLVYILYSNKNVTKRLASTMVIIAFLYWAYIFLLPRIPGLGTIAAKMDNLTTSNAGLLNGRLGLWQRAIDMFMSSPILGHGFGSYSDYASETVAITTSAHNYFLQIAAELGVVGLVLYIVAFISGVVSNYQIMKMAIKGKWSDTRAGLFLSIALAVQIFVLIYSMTSTSLMYYAIMIPYFLACATPRAVMFSKEYNKL